MKRIKAVRESDPGDPASGQIKIAVHFIYGHGVLVETVYRVSVESPRKVTGSWVGRAAEWAFATMEGTVDPRRPEGQSDEAGKLLALGMRPEVSVGIEIDGRTYFINPAFVGGGVRAFRKAMRSKQAEMPF